MQIRYIVLSCALVGMGLLGSGNNTASADTILSFGQSGNGSPIAGTKSGSSFEIKGTDVAITISQIDPSAGLITPLSAFLNVDLTSTAAASMIGTLAEQQFSGTFAITSASGGSGTNYLSGSFSGYVTGTEGSTSLGISADSGVSFTSGVITKLGPPKGFSLSFANVEPSVALDGTTLKAFTSSVSGTASAFNTVPEPASYITALMGLGGLVPLARLRRVRKTT